MIHFSVTNVDIIETLRQWLGKTNLKANKRIFCILSFALKKNAEKALRRNEGSRWAQKLFKLLSWYMSEYSKFGVVFIWCTRKCFFTWQMIYTTDTINSRCVRLSVFLILLVPLLRPDVINLDELAKDWNETEQQSMEEAAWPVAANCWVLYAIADHYAVCTMTSEI